MGAREEFLGGGTDILVWEADYQNDKIQDGEEAESVCVWGGWNCEKCPIQTDLYIYWIRTKGTQKPLEINSNPKALEGKYKIDKFIC